MYAAEHGKGAVYMQGTSADLERLMEISFSLHRSMHDLDPLILTLAEEAEREAKSAGYYDKVRSGQFNKSPQAHFWDIIKQMPLLKRQVLCFGLFTNLSFVKIAMILGMKHDTVHDEYTRWIRELRVHMVNADPVLAKRIMKDSKNGA